ncbi:MAG: helix-turn-helix domain-containing protein [Lachnospiraceae bacterium]|nr:helix-turn-helix domain-containing protein [Lachnospiraceae bacterium]
MIPLYETFEDDVEIFHKKNLHVPPHLHKLLEFVYITEGTLELGLGQELYHMEQGDFAVVFPGLIHHTQVFCEGESRAVYLLSAPSCWEMYREQLLRSQPETPVIEKGKVHKDIVYALNTLSESTRGETQEVLKIFIQLILARSIPKMALVERKESGGEDLVYRSVAYIAEHFMEPLSLNAMAKDLYISPYTLSRMFSRIFHMNFNAYLNDYRMEYVVNKLRYTSLPVTEIWLGAGFESQRTFNRVFKEKYHMSPREYRKNMIQAV